MWKGGVSTLGLSLSLSLSSAQLSSALSSAGRGAPQALTNRVSATEMVQLGLPRQAEERMLLLLAALQLPFWKEPQVPVAVPNDAKSSALRVPPPEPQEKVTSWFSGACTAQVAPALEALPLSQATVKRPL